MELIIICDGAVWIWNLVSLYYPQAVQIVDWYYTDERLEKIAILVINQAGERQAWLSGKEALWSGQVQSVIKVCQCFEERHLKALLEINYFVNNEQCMDYARFQAAEYIIGSGTIKSACKQIVVQHLCKSGGQWTIDGAVKTAKTRDVWLSGE